MFTEDPIMKLAKKIDIPYQKFKDVYALNRDAVCVGDITPNELLTSPG